MPPELSNASLLRKFRIVLGFFMIALVLSGLTAFPLEREMAMVCSAAARVLPVGEAGCWPAGRVGGR